MRTAVGQLSKSAHKGSGGKVTIWGYGSLNAVVDKKIYGLCNGVGRESGIVVIVLGRLAPWTCQVIS